MTGSVEIAARPSGARNDTHSSLRAGGEAITTPANSCSRNDRVKNVASQWHNALSVLLFLLLLYSPLWYDTRI